MLRRLICCAAQREDMGRLSRLFQGRYWQGVLQCLWVEQLSSDKQPLASSDLEIMRDFPPPVNTHLFYEHWSRWVWLLLRRGEMEAAATAVRDMSDAYGDDPLVAQMVRDAELYGRGGWRRLVYRIRGAAHLLKRSARAFRRAVG